MELVFLLIDEGRNENENGTFNVTRDFYEMPFYKKNYTDEGIEDFLKDELGDTVQIEFIGDNSVFFKLKGNDEHFKFRKALKIGDEYFKLEPMLRYSREHKCGNLVNL